MKGNAMKKLFEHAPIFFLYIVGATYLGLLALFILNIPVGFVTQNESVRNLIRSVIMQTGCCTAVFVLFRRAGNKYTSDNVVRLKEELPSMTLASAANLIVHSVLCRFLPGALTAVYFVMIRYETTVSEHLGLVFLVLLVCAALNIVFAALGFISGAKKRIEERAALTGGRSSGE